MTAGASPSSASSCAIVSGTAWGMVNGWLVARAKIPPLIVTLGTLSVALGLAQIITDGLDIRAVPLVLTDTIGYGKFAGIPALTSRRADRRGHRRDRPAQDPASAATPTPSAPTRKPPGGSASRSHRTSSRSTR